MNKGVLSLMQKQLRLEEMTQAIRSGRIVPERSREYWSEEERSELVRLFEDGAGITYIAVQLQRSEMAVIQQLMGMDMLTPPGVKTDREPKAPHCRCKGCRLASHCPRGRGDYREEQNA